MNASTQHLADALNDVFQFGHSLMGVDDDAILFRSEADFDDYVQYHAQMFWQSYDNAKHLLDVIPPDALGKLQALTGKPWDIITRRTLLVIAKPIESRKPRWRRRADLSEWPALLADIEQRILDLQAIGLQAGAVAELRDAAGPDPGAVGDVSDTDGQEAGQRRKWQDVAEQLKRLQKAGEQFPGYRDLAARVDAGLATVSKAVRKTPSLHPWAKPANASAPRTKHLNDAIADRTPQQREPDPAELAADSELLASRDALDAALAYCIDEAPAAMKAKIHGMKPEEKDNLARAALKHPERMADILRRDA